MIFNRLKISKNDKTVNSFVPFYLEVLPAWNHYYFNFILRCPIKFSSKVEGRRSKVEKAYYARKSLNDCYVYY